MNSLTFDLVPKGELSFTQRETGLEIIYDSGDGEEKKELGSVKTMSIIFLNNFLTSCVAAEQIKSQVRPPGSPNILR